MLVFKSPYRLHLLYIEKEEESLDMNASLYKETLNKKTEEEGRRRCRCLLGAMADCFERVTTHFPEDKRRSIGCRICMLHRIDRS
ncbi:unnamed protein product [Linum tenue]|uniref:Uncharacterized protein n=1 Tax=Linum tenue TaxID=586396 RepID=A0AAV0L520_9ROSI|nr:unnamed protein product [Linum tenue]